MPLPAVVRRDALALHAGEWVRFRGVAMRDAAAARQSTLVTHLHADLGDGWVDVSPHAWVDGRRLCRDHGAAVVVEFTAVMQQYESFDPCSPGGAPAVRYGLRWPRDVVSRGPAELVEMLADLVRRFGWDAVADAVAGMHGEGS